MSHKLLHICHEDTCTHMQFVFDCPYSPSWATDARKHVVLLIYRAHNNTSQDSVYGTVIMTQKLPMPPVPGGVSPMLPTTNALKVFCDVVNGKISTPLAIPH